MKWIKKILGALVVGASSLSMTAIMAPAQNVQVSQAAPSVDVGVARVATSPEGVQYLIFLVDRSNSMSQLSPAETEQAVIKHAIDAASLAGQNIQVLIICYGRDGITVFGEDGRPTVAYESLLKQLFERWPAAEGGTPMDATFEKLLEIVNDLPDDARKTVVLITDGEPDSLMLRPDVFPTIRAIIAAKREAVIKKGAGFSASVQQELLRQFEQPLSDPSTKEWKTLYDQQLPLEFQKTLEHAKALKLEGVRFLTVDFVNNPRTAEIHNAAGGVAEDLIVTSPNDVITKLHERKLTALPRLMQLPSLVQDTDPQAQEREVEVKPEPIAEAILIVMEFQPAIPDFFLNSTMQAQYGGRTFDFNPNAAAAETSVAVDGDGGVATLTLKLDELKSDQPLTLVWESTTGNLTAPGCRIHTFMRIKENLKADFRPSFVPIDVAPPYKISSSNSVEFTFGFQNSDASEIVEVSEVEAVFRNKRGLGQPVRTSMKKDPKHPEHVVSDGVKLAAGTYDVQLHIRLPSGVDLEMTLAGHLEVSLRDEAITVELPFALDKTELVSESRSHIDFGEPGDEASSSTKLMYLRSKDLEYPITVKLDGRLADSEDTIPTGQWLKFQPAEVTLEPGKAVPVKVTLSLPAEIEPGILDGGFEGKFTATLKDTDVALPVFRFKSVANVSDDEPVDRLSFVLRRPHVMIRVPYAMREWSNGNSEIRVPIDIRPEFSRIVQVWVRHTSRVTRSITVAPSQMVHDHEGKAIPQIRLIPVDGTSLTRDIAKDEWARFDFIIESDADAKTDLAEGLLEIYGPFVVTQSVKVEIRSGSPMLESTIWFLLVLIAMIAFVFAAKRFLRYLKLRRLTTGNEYLVTPEKSLEGLLAVRQSGSRIELIPQIDLQSSDRISGRIRNIPASTPIPIKTEDIETRPLVLRIPGEQQGTVKISDVAIIDGGEPEVRIEIESGGDFDDAAKTLRKHALRYSGMCSLACILVASMGKPYVVRIMQWLISATGWG